MILLSNDMFDYIVRLLGWAVEGGTKVSQHPVHNIGSDVNTSTYHGT